MTEPLLLRFCSRPQRFGCPGVAQVANGIVGGALAFALACLIRYESWPVKLSSLLVAVWVRARSGETWRGALLKVATLGVYPATAIAAFLTFSRVVIGPSGAFSTKATATCG